MALIDLAGREIQGKIVYYGPTLGGKTTNLHYIYRQTPPERRGDLTSIASDGGRTIFFDLMPLDLGAVAGFSVRYRLYTVAGQEQYERTRAAVLSGADGVVFVADAQRARLEDNIASLAELAQELERQGKRFADFPLIFQYNKTDLPDALPLDLLDQHLNQRQAPRFAAVAIRGIGVAETLQHICRLTTSKL
ncbi:MAG TPA: GTPase domain-containing protein [Thermomicrobiales bacterium]|nr:GTPase domain-containing protein [Thermomicrobiales bacterium]